MRKGIAAMAFSLCLLALSGCAQYEEVNALPSEQTEETKVIELTDEEPETEAQGDVKNDREQERIEKDGMIPSYLTGEMINVELAGKRPLAIMISNDKAALPHYGIGDAGVIYEAPVEGAMNRYMALIEDFENLERIGSVRSCRTYYTYFAREFEAMYAHFGQSVFALPYLERMEHLNGIEGKGSAAFYRSSDRKAPHNAYASGPKVIKAMDAMGYEREYPESYEGHYRFARPDAPTLLEDGFEADYVSPGYPLNDPWFEYNPEDGLYYRYQYDGPHKSDKGQLTAKNIIFQYCHWKFYEPSEYLDINVHMPCTGYYFTNGRGELISWEKDGELGVTRYYDKNGQEILLNPGKTWVCIIRADQMDKAVYYGEQAQ